jgi:hypothetical protein
VLFFRVFLSVSLWLARRSAAATTVDIVHDVVGDVFPRFVVAVVRVRGCLRCDMIRSAAFCSFNSRRGDPRAMGPQSEAFRRLLRQKHALSEAPFDSTPPPPFVRRASRLFARLANFI